MNVLDHIPNVCVGKDADMSSSTVLCLYMLRGFTCMTVGRGCSSLTLWAR